MKTLIAVPCGRTVCTDFFQAFVAMRRVGETRFGITKNTLIHDARNNFASKAIENGYDRVLWIDSDMLYNADLLEQLSADMDEGREYVSALCFKRSMPTEPVVYKELRNNVDVPGILEAVIWKDYPRDQIFQCEGTGFGAVMTSVPLLKKVWDNYGPPFMYMNNLGEDLSFNWRVKQLGVPMYCDSRVKVGHIGEYVYSEGDYIAQGAMNNE